MLRILYVDDEIKCNLYATEILNERYKVLGLDCEYVNNLCSLIQICVPGALSPLDESVKTYPDLHFIPKSKKYTDFDTYTIYLFHVSKYTVFPKILSKLLASSDIIKVGCGITLDCEIILKTFGKVTRGIIDNQYVAKSLKHEDTSMDGLAQELFSFSKYKYTSWRADWTSDLNDEMIKYSAYDAYLSIIIYFELVSFPSDSPPTENIEVIPPEIDQKIDVVKFNIANYILVTLKKTTIFSGKKNPSSRKLKNTIMSSCKSLLKSSEEKDTDDEISEWLLILVQCNLLFHNPNDDTYQLI